jgi:hypothetical protein
MSVKHNARRDEKVAEYIQVTTEAMAESANLLRKMAADQQTVTDREKSASDLVQPLVERLRALNLIDAGEEKQAADELSDHGRALALLGDLLNRYGEMQTSKSAGLGRGVDNEDGVSRPATKEAFYAIGERSFNRDRPSDRAFAAKILGR